jgi:hypothetical protein
MWKVTPSKSDTTWSMFAGAPLSGVSYLVSGRQRGRSAPAKAVLEQRLDENILVVEEKHSGNKASGIAGAKCSVGSRSLGQQDAETREWCVVLQGRAGS